MKAKNGHLRKKAVVSIDELIWASAASYDIGFHDGAQSAEKHSADSVNEILTRNAIRSARTAPDSTLLRHLGGERSGICRKA